MGQIIETVVSSLHELLSSAIKLFPAIMIALIIVFLTRYLALWASTLADQLGKRTLTSKSLQHLLSKSAYTGTWILGILIACVVAFPGLSLGHLVGTLGIGSVAIGFAFQDISKNFFSGILILIQRPFRIDDQIIIGDYEGTVERIDIRDTKIRTYDGERILIPNSQLFTGAVRVRTAFALRRTDVSVGVDYKTSLLDAKRILLKAMEEVEGVVLSKPVEIDLVAFGDSSIDLIVRYWTNSRQPEVRQVQTRAIMAIKEALDNAGIGIPYPIRTIYYFDQEKYKDNLPNRG